MPTDPSGSKTGSIEADAPFGKSRRLLTPRDFKRVFDAASFTLGNDKYLMLALRTDLGHARLGLVIARKTLRRAVDRNRIKRVVRETFRNCQGQLGSLDIVFLVRRGWPALERTEQVASLVNSWQQLQRKARRASGGRQ